jgi:Na+/H+-dicarboxylate symporter
VLKKLSLSTKILIGLVLGVIVGLALQNSLEFVNTWIKPFGTVFLYAIKMVTPPLVLVSIILGTASMGDPKTLGRVGGKTMLFYLFSATMATTVGLLIAHITDPGIGMVIPAGTIYEAKEPVSMVKTLLNMIPTNPFAALANGDMLQIIVFALLVGCAITVGGEKTKLIKDICESFNEVMFKIVNFIMYLAPFFIFCLIVPVCAANGPKILLPLLKVIMAVFIACAIYGLIFYGAYVKFLGHYSWIKWLKGFAPAMLVAFSTSSSNATLPVSLQCTQENLGVSKEVSSFCLCVGATVNMDGTAIYQGICALFIAQIYNIDLSFAQQATVVFTAVLASIGTAGVPGAGLIMLTMVMQSVGLPMEGLALIAGIDRILDMIRTTVNVMGDAVCAVIVQDGENRRAGRDTKSIAV